jgi:MFS family permease
MPEAGQPPEPLWRTIRELPRPVVVLLTGVAVNRMGSLLQIFLVLYLTRRGFSPAHAGFALTAYGAGSIAGVFGSGPVSDRIGPRIAIVVAMAGSGVLVALLPFVRDYPLIIGVCLLAGAIAQLYRPAALAMLASLTPASRLVVTSAAYRLGLNVGVMLAPLLGVALASYSYTLLFLADAATSVVFAVVTLVALPTVRPAEPDPRPEQARAAIQRSSYRALLADRRFLIVLGAQLAVALAEIQYQSVLPLQIEARGLPTVLYAVVLSLNGIMVILLELPLTAYVQKLPIRLSIAGGCALIGFGISLFGLPAGAWIFIAGAVVWTAGEIISAPSTSAYPALIAPPVLRNRYIAAMNTSQTLGYAVGPSLGTSVYELAGSGMWLMCLILGGLSGLGMWAGVTTPRSAGEARYPDAPATSLGQPAPELPGMADPGADHD